VAIIVECANTGLLRDVDHFWVVTNEADANELAVRLEPAVILRIDLGNDSPVRDIREWQPRHGGGEWEALGVALSGKTAYLAASPMDRSVNAIVRAYGAVETTLRAHGCLTLEVYLAPGMTLASTLDSGDDSPASLIDETMNRRATQMDEAQQAADDERETMYRLVMDAFDLKLSTFNAPFVVLKNNASSVAVRVHDHLGTWITNEYRRMGFGIAQQGHVNDTVATVAAQCYNLGEEDQHELFLRIAPHPTERFGSIVDLGDGLHRYVELTPAGWSVQTGFAGVYFTRPGNLTKLPVPTRNDPLTYSRVMREVLNVVEEDRALMTAYHVGYFTGAPLPVAVFTGASDSGKSTASQLTGAVLDGLFKKGRSYANEKLSDLAVVVGNNRIITLNNVSRLTQEMSDFICDVVDKSSHERRTLRTTAEITEIGLDAAIVLNGIGMAGMASDLKTRMVSFDLESIDKHTRRRGKGITKQLKDSHAECLGGLFDIACAVLRQLDSGVTVSPLPRMAEYAEVLAAMDSAYGTGGKYLAHYFDKIEMLAEEVEDKPIFMAIERILDAEGGPLVVRNAELMERVNHEFTQLSFDHSNREFQHFKSVQAFGTVLMRAASDFRERGISVAKPPRISDGGKSKYTYYTISRIVSGQ